MRRLYLTLAVFSTALCSSFILGKNDIYVPESLQPWVDWVLADNPHSSCPISASDGDRLSCVWVTETTVSVTRDSAFGATFELKLHAFAESSVNLPYYDTLKPQNVKLNGQPVAIGGGNKVPTVRVAEGSHTVSGRLMWSEESEPRFLEIPRSGVVRLAIDGQAITHPSLQSDGSRLWFSNEFTTSDTTTTTSNSEVVRVYRHFVDDVPQTLTTHIQVTVTGNARILEFGRVISDNYEVTRLRSRWPAILSQDGNLVVQVSPGTNEVQIDARATTQLDSVQYRNTSSLWPDFEYWGIQPRYELRVIRMEGAQRTDLSQINAPRRMRDLSGFVMGADDELQLIEEQRGSVEPYVSTIDLTRDIWLNFRGDAFTVADSITIDSATAQRVTSSFPLGSVRVDGESRMITYEESSAERRTSVYIKPENSRLTSVSKVSRDQSLPANSWSVEAERANAKLHLPPGWMLLWSHGIDEVEQSWLSTWGIWDVFLVLLLLCLVWGVGGWKWTLVVAGTVLVGFQFDNTPTVGWIVLTGMLYAVRAVKHDTMSKTLTVSFWVVFSVVAILCVLHSTNAMRNALHPQLAQQQSAKPLLEASVLGQEEIHVTGSAMPISDPIAMVQRYTAEDIQRMGALDFADFFSKIPQRFNSTEEDSNLSYSYPQLSTLSSTDVLEVVASRATGARLKADEERSVPVTFDPTLPVALQTGPGRPNWYWQTIDLNWNGPVTVGREMSLVLVPPWLTRILYALSALSTLIVLGYLLFLKAPGFVSCVKNVLRGTTGVATLVSLGMLFSPTDVQADIPDSDLLQELEQRLLALPDCLDDCAYLEEAKVVLTETVLRVDLQIHAEDLVAVPLPTENDTWSVFDVRRNGRQLPLLRERSKLYTLLDKGVHDITVSANIESLNQLDILFELIPGHMVVNAPKWRVEGLVRGQIGDRKLTFNRLTTDEEDDTATSFPSTRLEVTPYVSVHRQIILNYEPTLITRIARVAPVSGEITVRVPLLPNELVSTAGVSIEDEHMVVNFKVDQKAMVWESKLENVADVILAAPSIAERTERWSIIGSDFWNYDFDGIVPVDLGDNYTTFIPRSNEVLTVAIQQTLPTPGDAITVSSVVSSHRVEHDATTTNMEFSIIASQPGDIEITLPLEGRVTNFEIGQDNQPLPPENVVLVPVRAGNHRYSVDWKTEGGIAVLYQPPVVSFSQRAVNVRTNVQLPANRWTLWLAGSSFGSTVTFWSVLVGALIVAVALSKVPGIALSTRDAIILTIGVTFIWLGVLIFMAIWFLATWMKSRASQEIARPWLYRLGQVFLLGTTLLLLYVLITTIMMALTGEPNMYITGMSFSNDYFSWFSDEVSGTVPSAWVLSFPLWVYFVLMLVWVMWLLFTTLRWMRDWWGTFKAPVLWVPFDFKRTSPKHKLGRKQPPESANVVQES